MSRPAQGQGLDQLSDRDGIGPFRYIMQLTGKVLPTNKRSENPCHKRAKEIGQKAEDHGLEGSKTDMTWLA